MYTSPHIVRETPFYLTLRTFILVSCTWTMVQNLMFWDYATRGWNLYEYGVRTAWEIVAVSLLTDIWRVGSEQ